MERLLGKRHLRSHPSKLTSTSQSKSNQKQLQLNSIPDTILQPARLHMLHQSPASLGQEEKHGRILHTNPTYRPYVQTTKRAPESYALQSVYTVKSSMHTRRICVCVCKWGPRTFVSTLRRRGDPTALDAPERRVSTEEPAVAEVCLSLALVCVLSPESDSESGPLLSSEPPACYTACTSSYTTTSNWVQLQTFSTLPTYSSRALSYSQGGCCIWTISSLGSFCEYDLGAADM